MVEALRQTDLEVAALYRVVGNPAWEAIPVPALDLSWEGIPGDRNYGLMRAEQPYEADGIKGVRDANVLIAVVDSADMVAIAEGLDLPVDHIIEKIPVGGIDAFMARQLEANILLKGQQDTLSSLATVGGLILSRARQGEGAVLRLIEPIMHDSKPVANLVHSLERIGQKPPAEFDVLERRFQEVAAQRCGWQAAVYSLGSISLGDGVAIRYLSDTPQ